MTTTYTDLPEPELVEPVVCAVSAALSSPLLQGSSSSVMSPHPLGSMDDLELFCNPFYKPGWLGSQSIHQTTPPPEFWKTLGTCDVGSTGEGCVAARAMVCMLSSTVSVPGMMSSCRW